jgi:hypothetical protein
MRIFLGLLIAILWLTSDIQVSAQVTCEPDKFSHYINIIESGKEGHRVKLAATCAAKLNPSEKTKEVLISRLDQTLKEVHKLKPDSYSPLNHAEIVMALTDALFSLKNTTGYKKIEEYFNRADWNTRRDQEFFDAIAARGYHRPELTETFFIGLTKIPASGGSVLGRACSMFHRMNDRWVVRNAPQFIYGVVSAISRLEQEKNVTHITTYNKKTCEETLLSQLLDERMREAFLTTYLDKLTSNERQILNHFLNRITPPPDEEVVRQIVAAFLSIPWKIEFPIWQKDNPKSVCKGFHGESFVTDADDLWCTACSSQRSSFQTQFYFYPGAEGKACILQKIRFSYPTTSQNALILLTKQLSGHMGSATSLSKVHDFGSAYWEDVSFWNWQEKEVYVFKNKFEAFTGKGLPLIELLAREQDLVFAMGQEEKIEKAIKKENENREMAKKERLYQDIAKSSPSLISRLREAVNPETHYDILLELLAKIPQKGSERSAYLYLAEQLAEEIASSARFGKLKDWEKKKQVLLGHGIVYAPTHYEEINYNHIFLNRIIEEELSGYWAEEAFMGLLIKGCEDVFGAGIDLFKKIIVQGEDFLKRNPKSHIRQRLLFSLAQAHETGWSLSLASPQDIYVELQNYQADAPYHHEKAILYYKQLISEYPERNEGVLASGKLRHLQLGVDTNSRKFYCISD